MTKVRLSVSVSDSKLKRFKSIAAAAEKAGMAVDQRLKDIGVFTGSIDADKLERLNRIDGVSSVETEREVQLPHPDSPVQ